MPLSLDIMIYINTFTQSQLFCYCLLPNVYQEMFGLDIVDLWVMSLADIFSWFSYDVHSCWQIHGLTSESDLI